VIRHRRLLSLAVVGVAAAAVATVLATDDGDSRSHGSPSASSRTIPQPPLGSLNTRTRRRLAPASRRVDLVAPSFSPASVEITNPLFPVSNLRSAILVGRLDGVPWRAETTLLPLTETVGWNGMQVRTLRSQFVAYRGGRIFEVAVDRYAQARDGSVWYFGEDAFTYERGHVADTEGTWLAGRNGPPAMIMPARPRVGDVYRTENVPGVVFEQVTVARTDQTLNGPTGAVHGAMIGRELHMDEARLERKVFAPGYGEFFSGGGRTFEATALVVPADAVAGTPPTRLRTLFRAAVDVFDATRAKHWRTAAIGLARVQRGLTSVRASKVPHRLAAELHDAVAGLAGAVGARAARTASGAALDVASASLDLQLQYRPAPEIDSARLGLWTLRLSSDAASRDRDAVSGDIATFDWIRDRIPFARVKGGRIDERIRRLRTAAAAGQLTAIAHTAAELRLLLLRGFRRTGL
jgi:hypothetical protein